MRSNACSRISSMTSEFSSFGPLCKVEQEIVLFFSMLNETTSKKLESCTFLKDYNGFADNPIFVAKTG